MRICTIPQGSSLNCSCELFRAKIAGSILLSEVSADGIVVFCCHLERFEREFAPELLSNISLTMFPSLEEAIIIGGIGKDGDPLVILCRGAEKSNTPDINLLDRIRESASRFSDGLGERVEVADNDRNWGNRLSFEILFV